MISIAAYLGLLTSDGAVKARERESRMQAARGGFVDEDVASLEVDFVVASEASAIEILELSGALDPRCRKLN